MLEQGIGRAGWRAKYPMGDWVTHKREQLENGDRIVVLKEYTTTRAALFTFYEKDDDRHWILHADGELQAILPLFDLLVILPDTPLSDYSTHPDFGRF